MNEDLRAWSDLYQGTVHEVLSTGSVISPSRGAARELLAYRLKHQNPRDRLIFGHPIFDPIPAIGHVLWTMAGRMEFGSITYYNANAQRFSVDRMKLHGAYGPRLFGIGVFDQINLIIDFVKERSDTRRAIAMVYNPIYDVHPLRKKVGEREDETPCTVSLQFLPRERKLTALTYMRSQDVLKLLPLDVFLMTIIQEYVARCANMDVGEYYHIAGSFHAYEKDIERFAGALAKPSPACKPLPAMPPGDQRKYLDAVLSIEERIRNTANTHGMKKKFPYQMFLREAKQLPEFWRLLVHGLIAWAGTQSADPPEVLNEVVAVIDPCFQPFVRKHLALHSNQKGLGAFGEGLQ